jgi:hypothetical protein
MIFANLLLAALLAAGAGEPAPAAQDDEARIEELMAAEAEAIELAKGAAATDESEAPAELTFPPPPGTAIGFDDLGKMVGYPIRVRIGARDRVGTVERVTRNGVTLRAAMGGGFARFTLSRNQIAAIEAL